MSRCAAIQMNSGPEVEANLEAAAGLIRAAAAEGAELVVLPENFAQMGLREEDKLGICEVPGDGPIQRFLAATAEAHGIWLVGGTLPLAADNPNRVRASSLLFDPQGRCAARYDKIHLFDVRLGNNARDQYNESRTIEPGHDVVVADTPWGRLGLSVCYDLRFPELYRAMLDQGVEIISIPSAFTAITGRAHWEALVRSRAVENLSYVIAPNQAGIHANGRETFGHSMIVDPWGTVLERLETEPGFIVAELQRDRLESTRQNFPTIHHRRLASKIP